MASYAEIIDGIVNQVLVLDNSWEDEECLLWLFKNVSTNQWLKTSYTGKTRSKFAGKGDEYHKDLDAFITPKPHPSWKLNRRSKEYVAPKRMPKDGNLYVWNEDKLNWDKLIEGRAPGT